MLLTQKRVCHDIPDSRVSQMLASTHCVANRVKQRSEMSEKQERLLVAGRAGDGQLVEQEDAQVLLRRSDRVVALRAHRSSLLQAGRRVGTFSKHVRCSSASVVDVR